MLRCVCAIRNNFKPTHVTTRNYSRVFQLVQTASSASTYSHGNSSWKLLLGQHCSAFHTSSSILSPKNQHTIDNSNQEDEESIQLYSRSRSLYPRMIFFSTSLHTTYWLWYVIDFSPALKLDPTLGYVGLSLSIFMSCGGLLYPKCLIQSMRLIFRKEKEKDANNHTNVQLAVKTYSLPFVTPSKREYKYNLGEFHIDSANDATKIVHLKSDEKNIQKFNGHLAFHAKDRYVNLLMHLNEAYEKEDVVQNENLWLKYLAPSQTILAGVANSTMDVGVRKTSNGRKKNSTKSIQRQKRMDRLRRRAASA